MKRRNPFALLCALFLMLALAVFAHAGGDSGKFELNVNSPNTLASMDHEVVLLRVEPVWSVNLSKSTTVKIYAVQDPNPTPSRWSGAWLYRVTGPKEDRASAGLLTIITPLTGVAGKFTLNLDGFAGFSLRNSVPVAAILVGANFKLADQATLGLHAGPEISQNRPTGFSFGASLNVRF
jgi:hypothetical protein